MTKQAQDPERNRQASRLIVAYAVVERACQLKPIAVKHSNYPELSDEDWDHVAANVAHITTYGFSEPNRMYTRAYDYLTKKET